MAAPTLIPKSSYYDGVVTESDRAQGRAGAPDFTVYGQDDLKLSAHPTIPFALVMAKGKASAYGVTAFVEGTDGSDLVVQCDSQTSGTRWDIITLRYDWRPDLGGPTDIRAINAGGKQIPTTLENTPGSLVDQPVWLVRWTGSDSRPAEYIDLRCFASNGGMMANNTLALDYLKKPGACVRIGDTQWIYRDLGNQQWGWDGTLLHAIGYNRTIGVQTVGNTSLISDVAIADPGAPYLINASVYMEGDSASRWDMSLRLNDAELMYAEGGSGLQRWSFPGLSTTPITGPSSITLAARRMTGTSALRIPLSNGRIRVQVLPA